MSDSVLGLAEFKGLIMAGHVRLQEKVDVVNALNIFPVPDGDTGTNMNMSLAAGVDYLQKSSTSDMSKAVQDFVTGLMMGARGNSGVILSQLFRGFSRIPGNARELDVNTFATVLNEGVQIAYRAVAKPVEGTILTVARESAQTGLREARKEHSLRAWFAKVYQSAQRALEKTPQQLDVLRQAGVVDSGGQGLVYIFEGFLRYLGGELAVPATVSPAQSSSTLELDYAGARISHEGQYGYCTEVLLRPTAVSAESAETRLREGLGTYGDSLLVVSAGDLVRAHVHTLHPGKVLEDALELGTLLQIKIENMTEQHRQIAQQSQKPQSASKDMKPLAIVVVAAGEGLRETFVSLGADVVLEGGQTMNPSTKDIVTAVQSANCSECILLPNNRNIWLAAEQAKSILGKSLHLVKTDTIPQGIAALVAFHPARPVQENVLRMRNASQETMSGQVVRAIRNSTYQGQAIAAGQYLGLMNQTLIKVGADRRETALAVISTIRQQRVDVEIVTLFYGEDVPLAEIESLKQQVEADFELDFEAKFGGQPVYDYIFSVE